MERETGATITSVSLSLLSFVVEIDNTEEQDKKWVFCQAVPDKVSQITTYYFSRLKKERGER